MAHVGIGTAPGVPFEDMQFPVAHIDQLYASFTPVISLIIDWLAGHD